MSALGQKQTRAAQYAMSALPPIATAKADFSKPSCLLSPRKRTCAVHTLRSALGQKRTCSSENRKSASRRSLLSPVCCFGHAASAAAFFFLRQPSRANAPTPVAKSGSAAGSGVVASARENASIPGYENPLPVSKGMNRRNDFESTPAGAMSRFNRRYAT